MSDQRQGGFGTKMTIDVAGSLAIAYAETIGDISMKKIIADMTGHDSPGGWQENIDTGKRSMDPFDMKLTWDPTNQTSHAALQTAFNSRLSYPVTWEDPLGLETIGFNAIISQLSRATPQENVLTCTVKITPTGIPTGVGAGSGSGGTP
jgi:hypothetical protein